jgi:radical SAM protein with 4Fe4S-binding SPASM domain
VDCGANRNGDLQLSPEQVVALDLLNPERIRDFKDLFERSVKPEANEAFEFVYTCGAGETSFTVDPYGNLQLCQLSRRHSFSLKEGEFTEGWNEFFPRLRARKWQNNEACSRCNLMSMCGNCPGAAEMETGDIEGLIPHFCEITHLRAHASIGEKTGHRRDATCCLGHGTLASQPETAIELSHPAGCGSCSSSVPVAAGASGPLIQLQVRRPRPAPSLPPHPVV